MGAKVLGVVSEIGPHEVTVTLPHGLRGYVAASEVRTAQADCTPCVPSCILVSAS